MPSTSPPTSACGPPGAAETTTRSVRPSTGSAPNMTPPDTASSCGWTSTAIVPGPVADAATAATARRKSAQPATPRTDVNRPAIEETAPSSSVDDDRTTSARSPSRLSRAHAARRSAGSSESMHRTGITNPGRTGRSCDAARARFAALAPVRPGTVARGSSRPIVVKTRVLCCTTDSVPS
ncbi:hypothetical protein H4W34_001911 [Actinomadura algeriensis]|uniref:Uncharacterized protein n=1 Tax=Actinomadura algeriensis TaxID=1679523 RepID=A0ABR9JNJ5_9ACTN|nr:hypothetical protein [Actinomadura algeriensis]MBE1532078.1 hypothetical protein [Actinomadura algeriensis]